MAPLAAKTQFRIRLRDLEDWLSTPKRLVHFDWSHDAPMNNNGKENMESLATRCVLGSGVCFCAVAGTAVSPAGVDDGVQVNEQESTRDGGAATPRHLSTAPDNNAVRLIGRC